MAADDACSEANEIERDEDELVLAGIVGERCTRHRLVREQLGVLAGHPWPRLAQTMLAQVAAERAEQTKMARSASS